MTPHPASSISPGWPEILPAIRRVLPTLDDLPTDEPPRIESGQNAIVWQAAPYIVRVPRHDSRAKALRHEVAILRTIGPLLPLPTPDVHLVDLPHGGTVAIHRALPGQPLMTLPGADETDRLAGTLGDFLRDLHAIPLPALDGIALPVANRGHWRAWLRDATRRLAPHLDPASLQRLDEAGASFRDALAAVSPVVIHGDFGGSNILAQDGAITGVIDFGSVQVGDPASDLAGLAASYGLPFLDRVAVTYPLAADPDVRNRIAFYRLAFAAMDALYGLDHADDHALRAGIAGVAQLASDDASPASGTSRQT